MKGVVILAKMRKSSKDVKRLRNAIKSAKSTATKAQNLGQDVIFDDVRTIKSFKTRKEFNKYLRDIEKFNNKNRFIKNNKGIVFNRNDIEQANKIIDIQNKQRKKLRNKIRNLRETEGGIVTPVRVVNANGQLWDDQMNLFTPVKHININTYTRKSQLDKRLDALKRNKNIDTRAKTFQSNYKKALREQVKQGLLTRKEANQMIKDINRLSPKEFSMWYIQERVTRTMFNYTDLTKEGISTNQKYVIEQIKSDMRSDIDMIRDSLAIKSGRARVRGGEIVYKK